MSELVVFCSCPNADSANAIARDLVEQRLAACVSLLPQVRSVYRWQGEVEEAEEVLLMIKTSAQRFDAMRERITALHSFDVPEIIALDIRDGLPAYLAWIHSETSSDSR
jgi:periplasmic divalent cation tolerance protein